MYFIQFLSSFGSMFRELMQIQDVRSGKEGVAPNPHGSGTIPLYQKLCILLSVFVAWLIAESVVVHSII